MGIKCHEDYNSNMKYITIRKYLPTIVVSVPLLFLLFFALPFPYGGMVNNIQNSLGILFLVSMPMLGLTTFIVQLLPNASVWGLQHGGWIDSPSILGLLAATAIIVIPVAVINYLLAHARLNQDVRRTVVRMQYLAAGILVVYLLSFLGIFSIFG
jgi:hypothetical protein